MEERPVEEWLARIDRGDQLTLRPQASLTAAGLHAGRLAGFYVVMGARGHWLQPAAGQARKELGERLCAFYAGRWVTASWRPNPCETPDPFDSLGYVLRTYGQSESGTVSVDIARQPDGRYLKTVTSYNDWDPLGSGPPATESAEMDEAAAREVVVRDLRSSRKGSSFPEIVKPGQ